jgi:D-alanyl-D-alanine carboxypeptidase (penicillin-binding protein 5/6)
MLKSEKKEFKQEVKLNENISAPIAKGDKVGELKILENGKEVTKIDLIAEEDVEKINFFNLFNKFITQFINLSN